MKPVLILASAALAFTGISLFGLRKLNEPAPSGIYESPEANVVYKARKEIDDLYARADWTKAKADYSNFVETYKWSSNKEIQDEVANARLRIGYVAAKEKNFDEARSVLEDADKEYRGTGAADPFYGSLNDQAAYQSVVCIESSGDQAGAEKGYLMFMKERPSSPLVHACWRRLKRISGGKSKPEHDEAFQAAVSKASKKRAIESAMCGPKSIAEILQVTKGTTLDYQVIAKECEVGKDGVSLEKMIEVLQTHGIKSEAFELNAKDFRSMSLPAIWLKDRHYVVLIERFGDSVRVYDSLYNSRTLDPLPKEDDSDFRAVVLKISK